MSISRGLIAVSVIIICLCAGLSWHDTTAARDMSADMPGIYEVASNGEASISVTDMHRHEALESSSKSWKLAVGLVVQGKRSVGLKIDPSSFKILDGRGRVCSPLSEDMLKNSLRAGSVEVGQPVVGSIAFELEEGAEPKLLIWEDQDLEIRLDKVIRPPGEVHPPGMPVPAGKSIVGIEGISASIDGRTYRIDYILKNAGTSPVPLQERAYGKFAILTDAHGISYSAKDYKMLGPAILPGDSIEGYLSYHVPDGAEPRYLLFWPPDDDAVIFDLAGL